MSARTVVAVIVVVGTQAQAQDAGTAGPGFVLTRRLSLERYKETIRMLSTFGDRRQGTERNRKAMEWIEQQLSQAGCRPERMRYTFEGPAPRTPPRPDPDGIPRAVGGGRPRGLALRTWVNTDAGAQSEPALRALNAPPAVPGPRMQVYATKVGGTRPFEMYVVGAHMDGHGWGEAANDDASGTALVLELARVLCAPDVVTERSVRFVLFNNEETGLDGAKAYVAQRAGLQGKMDPPDSGSYPEPTWLGMIQHDMMLFDHGAPLPDGGLSPRQRPEADVNIEFQASSAMSAQSQQLAWALYRANEKYATDYPAAVGPHMTNTDSVPFQELVPAVSLRENERGVQIGNGWDPHWHQPSDLFRTFDDDDFRLGLNAAQTTLGALVELVGARVR